MKILTKYFSGETVFYNLVVSFFLVGIKIIASTFTVGNISYVGGNIQVG